jgi:hypothetical protein
MKGLRISKDSGESADRSSDYSFFDLIEPIEDCIARLYWILEFPAEVFSFAGNGQYYDNSGECHKLSADPLDELIELENYCANSTFGVAPPGFFPKYARFIIADWQDIAGIKSPMSIENISCLSKGFIENQCELYYGCADGTYWEVYSQNDIWLKKISVNFPLATECYLADSMPPNT